jgi:O-acetyl-ADP-ribose deacetylase (regulator of RNase III)
VGPIWFGGEEDEAALLAACYRNSLRVARRHDLKSIAFPAISTGLFGYPPDLAADIAVAAIRDELAADDHFERVILCCFGAQSTALHRAALEAVDG